MSKPKHRATFGGGADLLSSKINSFCPNEGTKEVKQLRSEEVEFSCHCEGAKRPSQSQSFDGGKPLTRICKFAEGLDLLAINVSTVECFKNFIFSHSSLRTPLAGRSLKGRGRKIAFTLAEVLITLGIIGVVAAVTMPVLVANIQDRVRTEQVRSAKYKLTLATDKMKSLGLLLDSYSTTEAFVNELKKHFKIAKICDSNNLRACWPSDTIEVPTTSGTYTTINVSTLKKGTNLKSLGLGTGNTDTVGIITGDGVPMIMTYSPQCTQLEPSTTFSWTSVDGKPVTNATTNCISAIFDINGGTGPNRIGKDVRTLNSLFGSVQFGATSATKAECEALKKKGLVKGCSYATDYYAGAVKKCNELGLHLPSFQTLAVAAGARYGRTDIGPYTLIMINGYGGYANCEDYYKSNDYNGRLASTDKIICVNGSSIPNGTDAPVTLNGNFWSSSERTATTALIRSIYSGHSSWYEDSRNYNYVPLCVGD